MVLVRMLSIIANTLLMDYTNHYVKSCLYSSSKRISEMHTLTGTLSGKSVINLEITIKSQATEHLVDQCTSLFTINDSAVTLTLQSGVMKDYRKLY